MKADKKVAIEVKSHSGRAEPQLQSLREMFSSHPDWELRVIYPSTQNTEPALDVAPRKLVVETLDRVLGIFDEAGPLPALLTGWSVFEAAARSLIPDDLGRPQTPARLLETLAGDGYITPSEADALRIIGRLRDRAAHGRLDVAVTRDQIGDLVSITRTVLESSDTASGI